MREMAIKVKVVYDKKYNAIGVYVYGLERLFETLRKYRFEQGDDEDGVLWWFGYPEDIEDIAKFIDELKKVADSVEYVEKQ